MKTKYILVLKSNSDAMQERLDLVKGDSPFTDRYSVPVQPNDPTYPFVLFQIDDRAIPALTEEEWSGALDSKPAEFVPIP